MGYLIKVRVCKKPDCNNHLDKKRDLFVAEAAKRNIKVLSDHCLVCTKDELKRRIILAQDGKSEASRLENEEDRKKRAVEKRQKKEILPDKITDSHLTRTEAAKILRLTTAEVDDLAKAGMLFLSWSSLNSKRRVTKESLKSFIEAVISDPTLEGDDFSILSPYLSRRLIKRVDYFAKLYTCGVLDD
jgi:hypothetical protein